MNWVQIKGKGKQMTGPINARWADLTDDESTEIEGNHERLEGKHQEKYGRTKEQMQAELDGWLSKQ